MVTFSFISSWIISLSWHSLCSFFSLFTNTHLSPAQPCIPAKSYSSSHSCICLPSYIFLLHRHTSLCSYTHFHTVIFSTQLQPSQFFFVFTSLHSPHSQYFFLHIHLSSTHISLLYSYTISPPLSLSLLFPPSVTSAFHNTCAHTHTSLTFLLFLPHFSPSTSSYIFLHFSLSHPLSLLICTHKHTLLSHPSYSSHTSLSHI